jgi:hypothetical protein
MSWKWIAGDAVGATLLVIGAAGSVTIQRSAPNPVQDGSLPGYARDFMATCRGAVRERNANQICRCMVDGFDGALRTEDEYRLAGEIVKAIVQSGANKSRMQASFNRVSQDFHGYVSIERKQAVLRVVSTHGVSCGNAGR